MSTISTLEGAISIADVRKCLQKVIPDKTVSPSVSFGRDITTTRAFLYGIVCKENNQMLPSDAFLAGCNRFGVDNPCPTVTKRLANYGNADELDKDFKRIVNKYKN